MLKMLFGLGKIFKTKSLDEFLLFCSDSDNNFFPIHLEKKFLTDFFSPKKWSTFRSKWNFFKHDFEHCTFSWVLTLFEREGEGGGGSHVVL